MTRLTATRARVPVAPIATLALSAIALRVMSPNQVPASANTKGAAGNDGPFCGLYCVYAACKLAALRSDSFEAFLSDKYISSEKGSSIGQLVDAAQDHGLSAVALGNIGRRTLEQSPCPIILHVRKGLDRSQFDHFILILASQGDRLKVLDPGSPSNWVEASDILTKTDGMGLAVSAKPIDVGQLTRPDRVHVLWVLVLGLAGFAIARLIASKLHVVPVSYPGACRGSAAQGVFIVGPTVAIAMVYGYLDRDGLLSRGQNIPEVILEKFNDDW